MYMETAQFMSLLSTYCIVLSMQQWTFHDFLHPWLPMLERIIMTPNGGDRRLYFLDMTVFMHSMS